MVSVCVAVYNGERFIQELLLSILVQIQPGDEIIISDDGSTDKTLRIINDLADKRIKIISNKKRKGVIWNFENALMHCKGDFIFLADQDDIWLPNKVEVILEKLRQYEMVQSDATIINSNRGILHESLFSLIKSKKGLLANLLKNTYVGCTMAFRREVLSVALPFPKSIPMHDLWLGIVGEAVFSTNFIEEKLMLYRKHESNLSTTALPSPNSIVKKIKFRIDIIRYIPLIFWRRTRMKKERYLLSTNNH